MIKNVKYIIKMGGGIIKSIFLQKNIKYGRIKI